MRAGQAGVYASAFSFVVRAAKQLGSMASPQIMRKNWTEEEVLQLRKLVRQNTPAPVIARKLNRSITAVYMKASRERVSLRIGRGHDQT